MGLNWCVSFYHIKFWHRCRGFVKLLITLFFIFYFTFDIWFSFISLISRTREARHDNCESSSPNGESYLSCVAVYRKDHNAKCPYIWLERSFKFYVVGTSTSSKRRILAAIWGILFKTYAATTASPQQFQSNSSMSMDHDKILQVLTSLTQGLQNQAKEMSELKNQLGEIA